MKSSKKRSKQLLKDIQQSAQMLYWIADGVDVLEPLREPADSLIQACSELLALAKILDKYEFIEALTESEAFSTLCDVAETDVSSLLEERMFAIVSNHSESETGRFFQQLLSKLENHQSQMLDDIQLLIDITQEQE